MKKICILSTGNIKHTTIINHYTKKMEELKIDYDILYIDKYSEEEIINAKNKYIFRLNIKKGWPFLLKFIHYWKFKSYAINILKKNHYDFIIVWNSFTALLFVDYLVRFYKKKYCINIRDYAYEKILPIFLIMRRAIYNSAFTTISSEKYTQFLPKYNNYIIIHSLNKTILNDCNKHVVLRGQEEPIRISFIGYVRYYDNDKKLIDALGNDIRFIVQFFGEGADVLDSYAKSKGYNNIICYGRFEHNKTSKFLEKTDIINSLYGVGKITLDTPLSIKLYYSAYLYIPILVNRGTYMQEISEKYEFGLAIDEHYLNLGNKIYGWYHNLNFNELIKGCDDFIKTVESDNKDFEKELIKFIL